MEAIINNITKFVIGSLSIMLGLTLIGASSYYLYYGFGIISKQQKTNISVVALRVSYILAIGGLIVIVLGLLFLMEIIPWWS